MIKRLSLAAFSGAVLLLGLTSPAWAAPTNTNPDTCTNTTPLGKLNNIPCVEADGSTLDAVLSAVFVIAGSLSLLFLVIGGFRYVLSGGDPENTKKAKNTVLYSIIGLGISLSAFVVINYVLSALNP
jgi:hypothetical protein